MADSTGARFWITLHRELMAMVRDHMRRTCGVAPTAEERARMADEVVACWHEIDPALVRWNKRLEAEKAAKERESGHRYL